MEIAIKQGKLLIEEGVTAIGERVFENGEMQEVEFPNTLKLIGFSSFAHCKNLRTLEIPEGVLGIGNEAFYGCEKLEEVSIPTTVERIENAFHGCPNLRKVRAPFHLIPEIAKQTSSSVMLFVND